MTFQHGWWLVLVALIPLIGWSAWRRPRAALRFPTLQQLPELVGRMQVAWHRIPLLLRLLALVLLVMALARPQHGMEMSRVRKEGIDIVMVVDVSTSMLAEDFELRGKRHNRLDVVKSVATQFIDDRPNDRIGLVVFAGRPYTACPLTLDHDWLARQFDRVRIGMIEDGTAIGAAIATGLNRLRDSTAPSRVMILLTDGVNNAGTLTPAAAAELATALEVKIYAIGAGSTGPVPYPRHDMFGRKVYQHVTIDVDDATLRQVAEATDGQYFRATDTASLQQVYTHIDAMETTSVEAPTYQVYHERYPWFAIPALLLVLGELVLGHTWLRVLP
jgi:Ca-activated chloride channel homolog